jgi:hypothetical protein
MFELANLPQPTLLNSMHSLWRGDVLLGHINPELPGEDHGTVFGVGVSSRDVANDK